jgi:hypothetical protein
MQSLGLIQLLLAPAAPPRPYAHPLCLCVRAANPQAVMGPTATVFVGRVLAVKGLRDSTETESPAAVPYFQREVTLLVEQGWSGAPPDTVRAAIEMPDPLCLTSFIPGERYLVFATSDGSSYVISECSRTSELDSEFAQSDLRALGRPRYHRS